MTSFWMMWILGILGVIGVGIGSYLWLVFVVRDDYDASHNSDVEVQ